MPAYPKTPLVHFSGSACALRLPAFDSYVPLGAKAPCGVKRIAGGRACFTNVPGEVTCLRCRSYAVPAVGCDRCKRPPVECGPCDADGICGRCDTELQAFRMPEAPRQVLVEFGSAQSASLWMKELRAYEQQQISGSGAQLRVPSSVLEGMHPAGVSKLQLLSRYGGKVLP